MIDLHLHTDASDGRCSPAELVARVTDARLSVISVVDHDTFAAQSEVHTRAARAGIRTIPGIEITAVWRDLDVHVLGYYLDPARPDLARFLEEQRADRVRRVHAMIDRLRAFGVQLDFERVVAPAGEPRPHAIGRPQIARALIAAGVVADAREAFDRYLAEGRPVFVPRIGAMPAEVVRLVVAAGGVASLAHPGLLGHDEVIPDMVAAGMQAIEVYHPEHTAEAVAYYRGLARRYGLAASGGSDYHAEEGRDVGLGRVTLPAEDFERFQALVGPRLKPGSHQSGT
jgi:predicted metal-dependent phosphoesterase TrpH